MEQHAPADELVVRPATLDDVEAIQAVGLLTWPSTYLPITSPDYVLANLERWWTRDAVARSIDQTLVAELDGRVVGLTAFGEWEGEPVIWKIYVLPEHHGQGVATRLMSSTLESLPAGRDVLIEFVEGNVRAQRFYEKVGFSPERTEPGELGTTTVWLRLRRD